MKNSIKILIGCIIAFIIIIIIAQLYTPKNEYYHKIADIVISLYQDDNYSKKGIKKGDINAIDKYLSTLTHENEEICLNDYIDENTERVDEENSPFVMEEDGICYIYYEDLKLANIKENKDLEMEPYDVLICDGYKVILYKSYFNPDYEVTKNDPKHFYIYDAMEKEADSYNFYYISSYDGTKINVKINLKNNKIVKIEVKDVEL